MINFLTTGKKPTKAMHPMKCRFETTNLNRIEFVDEKVEAQ